MTDKNGTGGQDARALQALLFQEMCLAAVARELNLTLETAAAAAPAEQNLAIEIEHKQAA
ncbi:MAG: hypothetical protein KGL46_07775 [Hyphomicrobiales bacterium]|nr:hypothetical protein [Hyphomicrobiales bacterium]